MMARNIELQRLEEQLTCSICLDRYTNPKILPCFHSFCQKCLEHVPLNEDSSLPCPACRAPCKLPENGVISLPTSFVVNSLSEVFSLLKKGSAFEQHVTCSSCQNNAVCYCEQCATFLCQECLHRHDGWKLNTQHRSLTLDEVATLTNQQPTANTPTKLVIAICTEHDMPLEIFCETCDEVMCINCTVKNHRDHEFDVVSDMYDKHRPAIEESLIPLNEKTGELSDTLSNLFSRKQGILQQGEATKEDIHQTVVHIKELLDQTERQLSGDVDSVTNHKLCVLDRQIEEVETTLRQMKECRDHIDQSLKFGIPSQVLSTMSQMMGRSESVVKRIKGKKSYQPLEQADIKLVKDLKIGKLHADIATISYTYHPAKVALSQHDFVLSGRESSVNIVFSRFDGLSAPVPLPLISCTLTLPGRVQPIKCSLKESPQCAGQYNITFTPAKQGLHQLHVRVRDAVIPGSPLTIPVSPPPKKTLGTLVKTITGLKGKIHDSHEFSQVELSPEREEPTERRDDKSDMLREVKRLHDVVIQKDEELTELNKKMKEQGIVTGHVETNTEQQQEEEIVKDHELAILREEKKILRKQVIMRSEELAQLSQKLREPDKATELRDQATQFNSIAPVTDLLKVQKVDVGVQFNYVSLETDHLQGVTISRSKLFTVHGDQPQSLIWDGHGFELHLPANICLPTEDCEIMVDVVVGGEFVFPKGVEPVSAIYIISVTSKLHKPLLLKIQHCVALDKARKHSRLSFYRASLKEPRPPYHFRRVKGGKFDITNQFGELELPAFCSMAIGKDSTTSSSADESSSDTQSVEGNDLSSSSGFSDMEQEHPTVPEDRELSAQSDDSTSGAVDSSIMYFGQVFYLRTQLNEWQMKFIVVKHIEAFTSYVMSKLKHYEENVQVNMRFNAPHIELVLDREDAAKGWSVEPYSRPLIVSRKCASSFGYEKVVAVPPTCMVGVYGDNSVPSYAKKLHHPILLRRALVGDDDQEPEIFIKRTMAKKDDRNPVQSRQSPVIVNTTIQVPGIDQIANCIKEEINKKFPALQVLFENNLKVVAGEMLAAGIIPHHIATNPTFPAIIDGFSSGLSFLESVEDIEDWCNKFIGAFYNVGGSFIVAANNIKKQLKSSLMSKLNVSFNI